MKSKGPPRQSPEWPWSQSPSASVRAGRPAASAPTANTAGTRWGAYSAAGSDARGRFRRPALTLGRRTREGAVDLAAEGGEPAQRGDDVASDGRALKRG